MNSGTILAVLSLATAVGNLASYYPKMTSNRATLRPRREQALMALVLLLAVGAFFLHPGIIGYILGAIAIVPASLFLLGTFTSGLPHQQPAVAVDALAPDFLGWTLFRSRTTFGNHRLTRDGCRNVRSWQRWCPRDERRASTR